MASRRGQSYVKHLRKALRLIAEFKFTQEEYQTIAREALGHKKHGEKGHM